MKTLNKDIKQSIQSIHTGQGTKKDIVVRQLAQPQTNDYRRKFSDLVHLYQSELLTYIFNKQFIDDEANLTLSKQLISKLDISKVIVLSLIARDIICNPNKLPWIKMNISHISKYSGIFNTQQICLIINLLLRENLLTKFKDNLMININEIIKLVNTNNL